MKYETLKLTCSKCGKSMQGQKELKFKSYVPDQTTMQPKVELICDDCYKEWIDYWQVKGVVFGAGNMIGGRECAATLQNGKVYNCIYDSVIGGGTTNLDHIAPREFAEQIKWHLEQHNKEQHLKTISVFNVIDEFDRQEIEWKTYGGEEGSIKFRYSKDGKILLDPSVKLPAYLQEQIVREAEKCK